MRRVDLLMLFSCNPSRICRIGLTVQMMIQSFGRSEKAALSDEVIVSIDRSSRVNSFAGRL